MLQLVGVTKPVVMSAKSETAHVIETTPLISGMVTHTQVQFILDSLEKTLVNNIEGDVVELGCNIGTTSIFIRKMLDAHKSIKKFHVYDSFEGLPEKGKEDKSDCSIERYFKGSCTTSRTSFLNTFDKLHLKIPIMNSGWFSEISDEKYPDKISFAFFDGDFYQSIMDSFHKVYHKLTKGAIVCIHDFNWEHLPGVEKACKDFLNDKPETAVKAPGIHVGFICIE